MDRKMQAMQLDKAGMKLHRVERAIPSPRSGEILIRVKTCGVCRTDLHIVDGDIKGTLPIIPGHEIVGRIEAIGERVEGFALEQRVGVPWLGRTCGACPYCRSGQENLCDDPLFTGFTRDGGFATHCVADARFCFVIPDRYGDVEAAPLLCAGLIGYRSYRMTGNACRLGLYGFGAAAHILAQIAIGEGRRVFAFTRPGDITAEEFARSLGCDWAGPSDAFPPEELDSAIIFAPIGALVPKALRTVRKGGSVVCAGIHMSDIPAFRYADLWEERSIRSVANLTRDDAESFFRCADRLMLRTTTTTFPLSQANEALDRLRNGEINGAAVLVP